jgi:hypothetical protein
MKINKYFAYPLMLLAELLVAYGLAKLILLLISGWMCSVLMMPLSACR